MAIVFQLLENHPRPSGLTASSVGGVATDGSGAFTDGSGAFTDGSGVLLFGGVATDGSDADDESPRPILRGLFGSFPFPYPSL